MLLIKCILYVFGVLKFKVGSCFCVWQCSMDSMQILASFPWLSFTCAILTYDTMTSDSAVCQQYCSLLWPWKTYLAGAMLSTSSRRDVSATTARRKRAEQSARPKFRLVPSGAGRVEGVTVRVPSVQTPSPIYPVTCAHCGHRNAVWECVVISCKTLPKFWVKRPNLPSYEAPVAGCYRHIIE